MQAGGKREARLVSEAVEGFDSGPRPAAALPGRRDGVADAPVGQPAGAAAIQTFAPRQVQLSRGGQLRPHLPAVPLGFHEGEALRDVQVKNLP